MARLARMEVFAPDEVAIVHVMNRVVRRCFLLGDDPVSGKNYDHRKCWIEDELKKNAAYFGIDLLGFAILSNHFHLILRSRPDCVEKWDETEVARRWLMLCPIRKDDRGLAEEPNEFELNSIRNDPERLQLIRSRLSDLSWWMRLLCQHIAVRCNEEDQEVGRFFQSRYRAVRLLDEQALLACAAYVDLNPIRAAMAETLESSDFTSVQRRIQAVEEQGPHDVAAVAETKGSRHAASSASGGSESKSFERTSRDPLSPANKSSERTVREQAIPRRDQFLAPLALDERFGELGPVPNDAGTRCSDKGFLPMALADYLALLDWTGRQLVRGKKGRIPNSVTTILRRLKLDRYGWCELVGNFGKRFFHVAGEVETIETTTSRVKQQRYNIPSDTRKLFGEVQLKATATA